MIVLKYCNNRNCTVSFAVWQTSPIEGKQNLKLNQMETQFVLTQSQNNHLLGAVSSTDEHSDILSFVLGSIERASDGDLACGQYPDFLPYADGTYSKR
jgi:hypothetical protein